KLELRPVLELGVLPLVEQRLAQGSYVLMLSAPGRVAVRFPLVIARGERVSVRLVLPPAGTVPDGFVYVPEGRFLFGSSADEGLRRGFFDTVPLHEVRTGAYLIGRHEVTFAEWIEFLRALPPAERANRLPSAAHAGIGGALGLR